MSLSELTLAELQCIMGYFKHLEMPRSDAASATSEEEVENVIYEDLLAKVCEHFNVRPDSVLSIVETFQDLCIAASKLSQGMAMQSPDARSLGAQPSDGGVRPSHRGAICDVVVVG